MPSISNFIGRFISFISIVLMGIGFFMLIKTIKKSNRVRASSLLLSMIFSIAMLLFNVIVMRSAQIQWWFVLILIFGAGFGFAWGTTTALDIKEEKIIGNRSVLYIYFWLASLAITQVLALIAKTNVVALGLAGMFFSTGASLGTNSNILYRMNRLFQTTQVAPLSELKYADSLPTDLTTDIIQKGTILERITPAPRVIFGISVGSVILLLGAAFLTWFIVINQGYPISLNIGDNQISLSAPDEEQVQEAQISQDGFEEDQLESANGGPNTAPDPSPVSTATEESFISEGGDEIADSAILSVDFGNNTGNAFPLFSEEYMRYYRAEGLGVIESTTLSALLPIIFPDIEVKDFVAEFDFMMSEAYEDSRCGIIFRSDSDISDGLDAYYALFLYPKANTLNMGIWIDGQWIHSPSLILDPPFKVGYEFNHVRLEIKEESMKVYVNGSFASGFDEDTLLEPGLIGLFLFPSASVTDGNSDYVLFDNLQVLKN
jgi:membrane protein CcdC involved in cytochrome C biogenesis